MGAFLLCNKKSNYKLSLIKIPKHTIKALEKYKEQWLKNCDLLIVTSENEGFNRTIVEGMLSKIPVIAVDSGAHKEIIKDKFNGWLVEKNNLNELINVSIKILGLKKNNLKKTIERAEKYAKEKFNVQKHASYISKIYLNLTKL